MASDWRVTHWPNVGCHVFLSHVREDRNSLVRPIDDALRSSGIIPWFDRRDYPSGRDSMEALREELLKCRHVAYLISDSLLQQSRGWPIVERTYSELIQKQLCYGATEFQHFELPLVLADPAHPLFNESPWRLLLSRARFYLWRSNIAESPEEWAVREIREFVFQEQLWAEDIEKRLRRDTAARQHFQSFGTGILRRLKALDLPPLA